MFLTNESMAGIKSIGILTSGGDAPGMNAAIRAVTRSAIYNGFTVKGIMRGFKGLVFNEIVEFKSQSVSNIIQLGGTILKTARSEEFKTVEGRKAAYDNMVAAGIDALVVIGGDGSLTGAGLFAEEYNVPIVGLPGTIDNDLGGTDSTIGYDTALNTIMESVDKLRDTASSHERLFFVEVMGHKVGWLTLYAGISGGADVILIPELPYDVDKVCKVLKKRKMQGKPFSILAVAEGAISKEESKLSKKEFKAARAQMKEPSVSYRLANEIAERTGQEIRVTIPGHFQRGGSPCAYDRVLSTRFGTAAAELIAQKKFGYMVAIRNNLIVPVPLSEVAGKLKTVSPDCDEIRAARDMGISLGD